MDGARKGSPSCGQKTSSSSVIVGAAEVVAAVGAYQFAVVAGEAMTAVGANLGMVIDGRFGGQTLFRGPRHTTL